MNQTNMTGGEIHSDRSYSIRLSQLAHHSCLFVGTGQRPRLSTVVCVLAQVSDQGSPRLSVRWHRSETKALHGCLFVGTG